MRWARAAGIVPSRKDLALLAGHHGHMGRGYQDQSWEGWQSPSRSWQLWSGARKQAKGKGKQKNPSDAQFPAYDADRKQSGRNGWDRDKDYAVPSSEPAGLTQMLQTSLNGTRKAEQRVISLTEALASREKLWLQYEKDLKAAYQREYARFTKDVERLKDDLQKAKAAQAGARADLLRTFQGHQEPVAAIEDPMADVMIEQWRGEAAGADAQSVLRRALGAMTGPMSSGASIPPGWEAMLGPPGLVPGAVPAGGMPAPASMQPPLVPGVAAAGEVQMAAVPPRMPEVVDTGTDGNGEYAAAVPRDPYMLSPGNPLPAGAVPSPSQHYKGADGTRLAVKTRPRAQPPPLGSVPLGEKLEAKRHALAPFGLPNLGAGPPGDEAAMSDAATSTSANPYMSEAEIQRRLAGFAGVQSHTLIADDDDGPTALSS